MSFSLKTKGELARLDEDKSCCNKAELSALIGLNGEVVHTTNDKFNLKITVENPAVARKIFRLIKTLFSINPEIKVRKNANFKKSNYYLMVITHVMGSQKIIEALGLRHEQEKKEGMERFPLGEIFNNRCCKRAYLRGAFLSGGSISSPEKTYHLEFVDHELSVARGIQSMINSFGLNAKIVPRKKYQVVYLKEGDQIVELLNIIGAHNGLLELENARILKEMRNNINRIVNCETANLSKTVNASVKQLENIHLIQRTIGLDELPEGLRDLAKLRIQHEDASLKELGEMMNPPVGKSGINHRFRKLENLANKIQRKSYK